ncbi:hypothetical protein [Ekhidna sp.]|uniref:hypothetical protein n=1 Tax=Ekhidna sp. TaxID=2608089 RepID=UPI003296B352
MIKKTVLFLLIIVIVIVLYEMKNRQKPIDIIGDLESIRNTPTSIEAETNKHYMNINIIDSLITNQKLNAAVEFIDSLLLLNDDYFEKYLFERGKVSFELRHYDSAISFFRKVLNISNRYNLKAREWKAFAHINLDECDSALIEIKIAEKKNSSLFKQSRGRIEAYCLKTY